MNYGVMLFYLAKLYTTSVNQDTEVTSMVEMVRHYEKI